MGHTKHDEKCLKVCQHYALEIIIIDRKVVRPNKLCGPDAYFYGFDKDGYVTCKPKKIILFFY